MSKGVWGNVEAEIVGSIENGHIANTEYQFHRKTVCGGIAMTRRGEELIVKDDQTLIDPLTGEEFKQTRKKTGFFNAKRGLLSKPYETTGEDG